MTSDDQAFDEALRSTATEIVDTCILHCDGVAGRDTKWEGWLSLRPPYGVMHCPKCGLRWLSPRPDKDGLAAIYSASHYFCSGGDTDYRQYAIQRRDQFKERIARLKQLGVCSVLDYGAATGEFVVFALEAGLDAVGVEFSEAARAEAKGLHGISLLSPEEGVQLSRTFDAIHMNHVLEHMPNPLDHLRWCFDQLRPGGVLVAEVPRQFENDADRLRRFTARGGRQTKFDAFSLHHTYFFTPDNLRMTCQAAGFNVTSLQSLITPNPNIESSTRHILERLLAWSARKFHGGDVIEVYGIKPTAASHTN